MSLLVLIAAQAVVAQAPIDATKLASKADVAAIAANACPPGSTIPSAESTTPSAGSATTCVRSDFVPVRITRAGMASATDANGTWSITWSKPLPSAPVTLPLPMNTGNQPIVCNVSSSTMTGAAGRCWLARPLPAALLTLSALLAFDPNGAPAAGITVQVLAIPITQ
ncbi:hypothetical protein [Sphingomonas sp. Leaf37]|uniref:hypothetical protein n=1 Tax=Sphingomonas sp. Leaf37 TaxID=2876552 RepID=UPI001E558DE0|nr:hypothetical protein [Sphingomonas sp. Leaf37]